MSIITPSGPLSTTLAALTISPDPAADTNSVPEDKGARVPPKILAYILEFLPLADVRYALRASPAIYTFLAPRHYRNIYQTLAIDFDLDPPPYTPTAATHKAKKKGGSKAAKNKAEKARKAKDDAKVKSKELATPPLRAEVPLVIPLALFPENPQWEARPAHPLIDVSPLVRQLLPNPFAFTTDLSLPYHINTRCTFFQALVMPSLHTLRIIPRVVCNGSGLLDLCVDPEHLSMIPHAPLHQTHPTCPLILGLRPKRLILGGEQTSFAGMGVGLWTAETPFPPPWLDEIVIFIGESVDLGTRTLLMHVPTTIKRVSMVIQPPAGRKWLRQRSVKQPLDFWLWLASSCLYAAAEVVEIVGLENIDARWSRAGIDGMKRDLKAMMRRLLQSGTVSEAELAAAGVIDVEAAVERAKAERLEQESGAVRFIERKTWDERER